MTEARLLPHYEKLFSKVFAVNSLDDYADIDEEFLNEVIEDVRGGCLNVIDLENPAVREEYLGSSTIDYKNYNIKLMDRRKILNLPKTRETIIKKLALAAEKTSSVFCFIKKKFIVYINFIFKFSPKSSLNEPSCSELPFKKGSASVSLAEKQHEEASVSLAEEQHEEASGSNIDSRQSNVVRSVLGRLQAYLEMTSAKNHHDTTAADIIVKRNKESFTIIVKCFACAKMILLATNAKRTASVSNFKRHFSSHL
jgi:hypothetical protein